MPSCLLCFEVIKVGTMDCHSAAKSAISQMFIDDCEMLFQHYGCDAKYRSDHDALGNIHSLGVIDAGSPELEFTLLLNVPFSILALSYPCQDMILDLPEEQLEDWLLELANQLMGKLKGRLLQQQLTITLGLPESFFDVTDVALDRLVQTSERFVFEVDGELLECWLHIDIKVEQMCIIEVQDAAAFSGEVELF